MKTIIALAFAVMSFNVLANEIPEYYSAKFRIVRVAPICPSRPGQISCMAVGGRIYLEAMIGCTDKLVFSQFEELSVRNMPVIHAVSLVRRDENADRIRCRGPQIVRKEIYSGSVTGVNRIHLENIEIETR